MKHFTVSKKGCKGYLFTTHSYRYELTVAINDSFVEFDIYANNRQAAITSATIIIQSDDIKREVEIQNAKQQINVAKGLLVNNTTEYTFEQITDYINRINVKYNLTPIIESESEVIETVIITEPDQIQTTQEPITLQSFTAYNRSFSTFSEAHTYCINSDFDPSYIEVVDNSITSQINPNDSNTVTVESSNKPDIFIQSEKIRDHINSNGWTWNDYSTLSNITGETEETCKKIFGIYNIIIPLRKVIKIELSKKGLTLIDKLDTLEYFSRLDIEEQNKLVLQFS